MDKLRIGRFALLFAAIGIAAITATFFVPTLFVLSGLFGVTALLLGLLGVRTGAGRAGLVATLLVLPCATLLAYRFGWEARAQKEKRHPLSTTLSATAYFSPNGGCTDAIVAEIANAKRNVLVQAYSFASKPIAEALVAAHRRGVAVAVLLDPTRLKESGHQGNFLSNAGVDTRVDAAHKLAHNKVIIIDSSVVVTGSMNFSKAGESQNAENMLVLRDHALAAQYTNNWQQHSEHSDR